MVANEFAIISISESNWLDVIVAFKALTSKAELSVTESSPSFVVDSQDGSGTLCSIVIELLTSTVFSSTGCSRFLPFDWS